MFAFSLILTGYAESVDDTVTLPEKMQLQIALGSGLKGLVQLQADGEGDVFALLQPFHDAEIALSLLEKDAMWDLELSVNKEDEDAGTTVVFSDGESVYVLSDWLMDTTLQFPVIGSFLSTMVGTQDRENPDITEVLFHLLSDFMRDDSELSKAWVPLQTRLSTRLDAYAGDVVLTQVQGQTQMIFRYLLTPDQLKTEMKQMLSDVMSDADLLKVLGGYMTAEQAALYLNPGLLWYYQRAVDDLQWTTDVVCERTVTMQGEEISTSIQLPLTQFQEESVLTLTQSADTMTVLLEKGETSDTLVIEDMQSTEGQLTCHGSWTHIVGDEDPLSRDWSLAYETGKSVDSESVTHETGSVHLTLESDEEDAANVFDALLVWAFSSKPAKRAATTLEARLDLTLPDGSMVGRAILRTQTPWDYPERSVENVKDLRDATQDERMNILSDLLINGVIRLSSIGQAETDAGTDDVATQTDLVELATMTDLAGGV